MALFVVGKGVLKPRVQAREPLSSATNTIYTALTQPRKVRPKKPGPTPDDPLEGSVTLGPQCAGAPTKPHVCHREQSTPQAEKAGPCCRDGRENKRDWVKLAAGHEIRDGWFTRGNKSSCSVCEQAAVPSLSHC